MALRKIQKFGKPDLFISRLMKNKIPHSIRLGSECTEIILGTVCFTFTSTANFPRKKLFLFNSVKKNVLKYLEKHGDISLPPEYEVTKYNLDYDDSYGTLAGTDLNHAYWRIAFIKGLISEKTYEYGLDPDCKALRLATLSVLGREKSYKKWEEVDGEFKVVENIIIQPFNETHKKVFKYIRLVCFCMMNDLAQKLGKDFDCWKTDCIYYRDSEENRKLVHDYFSKKQMDFKQLDFFEEDEIL